MKRIGITGGIGSGKTTVSRIFEVLKVPVFYADTAGKELLNTDQQLIEQVKALFGDELYKTGALDKKALARIVFNDEKKLKALNNLVHPAVGRAYQAWVDEHKHAPYTLKEAAILFESGSYKDCDAVIYISAPEQLRIHRVCKRDGVSGEEVKQRMKNQWPEGEKAKRSTYTIVNDDDEPVIPQVMELHQKLSV